MQSSFSGVGLSCCCCSKAGLCSSSGSFHNSKATLSGRSSVISSQSLDSFDSGVPIGELMSEVPNKGDFSRFAEMFSLY